MERFAKIDCYPPLGQVTLIAKEQRQIRFTTCLQSSKALPELPWEVAIWHNCPILPGEDVGSWKELILSRSSDETPFLTETAAKDNYCYTFSESLYLDPNSTSVPVAEFTIKFRSSPASNWQWVRENFGLPDGSLVGCALGRNRVSSDWASSVFGDQHLQDWNINAILSQSPDAELFKVESKDLIPSSGTKDAQYETKVFGSSHVGFYRYMALVRIWTPWLAPRQGEHKFHVTEDAILCSFLTFDGRHVVLLAINGVGDKVTVFRSDADGRIVVATRNDSLLEARWEFLAAVADDFETANAAVMYAARDIVVQGQSVSIKASADFPKPQWLEEWYDGLIYCTWNALGQDLTAEKIYHALAELAARDINVSGLIIDDNWQSLDGVQGQTSQFRRGWMDFDANKSGFPQGLKATVNTIQVQHPAIKNVAVWHGLHGYWGGLSPCGSIAKNYKTVEVERQAGIAGGKMLAIDPSDIDRFYDDFYAFLSTCGVTSIKTDVQFYLDLLAATADRRALTDKYQFAWMTAQLRHFGGKAISCMSQIPQILYHSFLPTTAPRLLLRNSDDFFPTIPASHPWHIFCNAHNALFVQHLNVLPDWDMFQTSHPYSGFHAAARCVSGGPIYVTDAPGEHNLDLLAQMTAKNTKGNTVILRPSVVGKSIGIYDQYHEGHVLRVGTYNGLAETGNPILGLFNISDHEISAMIPIADFPGITPNEKRTCNTPNLSRRFVIRSHVLDVISRPISPSCPPEASNLVSITLPIRGYDVLTASPVYDFPALTKLPSSQQLRNQSNITSIAILGLLGKMTGACALSHHALSNNHRRDRSDDKEIRIHVTIKALGTLGIWISDLAHRSIERGFLASMHGRPIPRSRVGKKMSVSAKTGADNDTKTTTTTTSPQHDSATRQDGILKLDLLGAWEELFGFGEEYPAKEIVVEVVIWNEYELLSS